MSKEGKGIRMKKKTKVEELIQKEGIEQYSKRKSLSRGKKCCRKFFV